MRGKGSQKVSLTILDPSARVFLGPGILDPQYLGLSIAQLAPYRRWFRDASGYPTRATMKCLMPPVYLSIYLSIYLSVYISIYLSIYLSNGLPFWYHCASILGALWASILVPLRASILGALWASILVPLRASILGALWASILVPLRASILGALWASILVPLRASILGALWASILVPLRASILGALGLPFLHYRFHSGSSRKMCAVGVHLHLLSVIL